MKKFVLITSLFVNINGSVDFAVAQTIQVTPTAVPAPGFVVGVFRFLKERPTLATGLGTGIFLGCILWHDDIFRSFQLAVRKFDRWINPNETKNEGERHLTIGIKPVMPIVTETPIDEEMLHKPKSKNFPREERGQDNQNVPLLSRIDTVAQNTQQEQPNVLEQKNQKILLQQEPVALDQNIQMQQTEAPEKLNQEVPKEQKQPILPTQQVTEIPPQEKQQVQHTEEELAVIRLNERYTKENHASCVAELSAHVPRKLFRYFLSAHTLKVPNVVKWCILDALAYRLVTQEKVTQKTILGDVLGKYEGRDIFLDALSEKAVFQLPEMVVFKTIRHNLPVRKIVFSQNNKFIAVIPDGHVAKVVNVETGNTQTITHNARTWYAPFGADGWIRDGKFSPDEKFFATASDDCTAKILNLENGNIQTISHIDNESDIAFSCNSKIFAIASCGNTAQILNLESGNIQTVVHKSAVLSIAFSRNNKFFATASSDQTAKIINLADENTQTITHNGFVKSIAFSLDSKFVATTSWDHTAKIMNVENENIYTITHNPRSITINNNVCSGGDILHFAFSLDSKFFATASDDYTARIMDLANGSIQVINHDDRVLNIVFSPNSKFVATTSDDNTVKVMNLENGNIQTIGHKAMIKCVTFSDDEKFLKTISGDHSAKIMNLTNGHIKTINYTDTIENVTFSPDGKFGATASKDGSTKIMLVRLDNFAEYLEYCIAEEQKKLL